ncbi:MAG: hypothetical protein Q4G05_00280 [Clostridia bacterium]|nr:hypothetical protein [Clostridia bacterium]
MIKKIRKMGIMIFASIMLFSNYCFAAVGDTVIVTGTVNLLNDVSNVLLYVAPIVTAVLIGIFWLRKSADDEMDAKRWNTRIKTAIICCIGVMVASGLITTITGYYR